jgi:hypothetical protein
MAVIKRVLCPERLRHVPPQFSWIDHRLVRDRHIAGRSVEALALYLFLVTVADGQGLSYYSDAGIGKLLPLDGSMLARARQELIRSRLIAYERPLYQVLSLDPFAMANPAGGKPTGPRGGPPQTLGQILRRTLDTPGATPPARSQGQRWPSRAPSRQSMEHPT